MLQRSTNKNAVSKNPWKIAFITLASLIIILFAYLMIKINQPSPSQKDFEAESTQTTGKYADVTVAMNKKQLQAAINYYLKQNQKTNGVKYRVLLDKSAIMMGTTKILGMNVSFTLYTKPTLDANGNIVFNAKTVAVGSLNAPASFILKYIRNNYDLGKWAKIDAKKAKITLNLNQLTKKQGVKIKGRSLNLNNNDIKFDLSIPLDNNKITTK